MFFARKNRIFVCSVLFVATLCLCLVPNESHAYIDPGTGASFVGSIVPLIGAFTAAVSALFVKIFWEPVRALVSKVTGKSSISSEQ